MNNTNAKIKRISDGEYFVRVGNMSYHIRSARIEYHPCGILRRWVKRLVGVVGRATKWMMDLGDATKGELERFVLPQFKQKSALWIGLASMAMRMAAQLLVAVSPDLVLELPR